MAVTSVTLHAPLPIASNLAPLIDESWCLHHILPIRTGGGLVFFILVLATKLELDGICRHHTSYGCDLGHTARSAHDCKQSRSADEQVLFFHFYTDTVLYKLNIAIKVSEWYNTEKIKSFQAKYEKRY